jgi:hypothetical protein
MWKMHFVVGFGHAGFVQFGFFIANFIGCKNQLSSKTLCSASSHRTSRAVDLAHAFFLTLACKLSIFRW